MIAIQLIYFKPIQKLKKTQGKKLQENDFKTHCPIRSNKQMFASTASANPQFETVLKNIHSKISHLLAVKQPHGRILIKTVWDVFGFHVSYTRELFPAELNAPAPRTVSVCDRAKVTTLPRESDVLSI